MTLRLCPPSPRHRLKQLPVLLATIGSFGLPISTWACEPAAGRLRTTEGVVEVRLSGAQTWRRASAAQALCVGDTVAVRERSRATVVLSNDVLLRLDQNSVLTLTQVQSAEASELNLLQGVLHVITRFSKRFGVITPYLNAMVDGTEFTVAVGAQSTQVTVTEGQVLAQNTAGGERLSAGQAADAGQGQAPTTLKVRPLDAVQWALYYPRISRIRPADLAGLPQATQDAIRQAAKLSAASRYTEALAAWPAEANAPGSTPPALQVARAGWLLGVGRIDEAQALLNALPSDDAGVQAQRAVVQVMLNQPAEALASARAAVARDPQAAAPLLALSYALQAQHDPEAALQAARLATEREDDFAIAWARRAELELSAGLLRPGEASAARAQALTPPAPRARTLLGFAQLLRGQNAAARASLTQAQADTPSDPLPHLGLGLALLRSGEPGAVPAGRRELELAVMLDPGDAELRALLGRAYLREDRDRLAGDQFDVARRLDPLSPTAWFYDGLRKQRDNRLAEAASDYEQAMALNDQRSPYRPPALLDSDRAARASALASVYRELGFDASMLALARQALADDPQSEAAHRLLAEAYAADSRFEIARVSELLQTQLRQSPRAQPIAPQELVPNLPVLNGPRALSLQESSPVFDETPGGLRLGLLTGSNNQSGRSALVWRNTPLGQLSVGHFHYDTKGFRADPAADVHLETTNLMWQAALTSELTVQAEQRNSHVAGGTTLQLLGPVFPSRETTDSTTRRLGARWAPSPTDEWLTSAIWTTGRTDSPQSVHLSDPDSYAPVTLFADVKSNDQTRTNAHLGELSYSHAYTTGHVMAGLSSYRGLEHLIKTQDTNYSSPDDPSVAERYIQLLQSSPDVPPLSFEVKSATRFEQNTLFTYGKQRLAPSFDLFWGLSYNHFERSRPTDDDPSLYRLKVSKTSPKLGIAWALTPTTRLRLASFQGMDGARLRNQSLEPTQFDGFNQVFQEFEGSRFQRTALAIDSKLNDWMNLSAETSRRRVNVISPDSGPCDPLTICYRGFSQSNSRVQVDMRHSPRWTSSAGITYDATTLRTSNFNGVAVDTPLTARSWNVPLRVNYHLPSGWGAYLKQTSVQQFVAIPDEFGVRQDEHARFWVTDLGLSYRQPSGRWTTLLDVANVFSQKFGFFDADIWDQSHPHVPRFQPGRTVTFRVLFGL